MDDDFIFDKFLSLQVSVPLESTKYAFIGMLLERMLNLKDEGVILDGNAQKRETNGKKQKPVEILPQVAVPSNLWLQNEIGVKNVKVKNTLLKEINTMLLQYVDVLKTNDRFLIDETTLIYYEKIVTAYNFLEFARHEQRFDPLIEDEEDEHEYAELVASGRTRLVHATELPINPISTTSSRPVSTASRSLNRISTLSREFLHLKRKRSFLGTSQSTEQTDEELKAPISQPSTPQQRVLPVLLSAPQFYKDPFALSLANGILSKSRIYNKMIKKRELYSLASSTFSAPTSISSVNSNASLRRKSNPYELNDKLQQTLLPLSAVQRIENQKDKHEYYIQARGLAANTNALVGYLGKPGSRAMLIRLMEFIKNSVFKFIIIDISLMIIDYGHLKATETISS